MEGIGPEMAFQVTPSWSREANCNGLPFGYMYPQATKIGRREGLNLDEAEQEVANNICHAKNDKYKNPCPRMKDCLDFAQETRSYTGVWGGLTEQQRKILRQD